MEWQRP